MNYFLAAAAGLHGAFMVLELFPWKQPFLLKQLSSKKLSPTEQFSPDQQNFVATIVRNAAIYNGIVCGGLLWASVTGSHPDVARVMLIGAMAAGIFGAITLKHIGPAIQALVGIVCWFFI
jgi:uncharacterized membrane protein